MPYGQNQYAICSPRKITNQFRVNKSIELNRHADERELQKTKKRNTLKKIIIKQCSNDKAPVVTFIRVVFFFVANHLNHHYFVGHMFI